MRNAVRHSALATAIRSLAAERNPGCLVDAQGAILFVNEAWERHAAEHPGAAGEAGEPLVGTRWLDHVGGEAVRDRCAALFARALEPAGPRPRAVTQVSERNTPQTAALVSTRLEQVLNAGEPVGVRIVHAVVRERPISEVYEVVARAAESYRDAEGRITQCPCCGRLRDPSDAERWDLVPEALAGAAPRAQAVCGYCAELHLGGGR